MYERIVWPKKECAEIEEFSLPDTLKENEILVKTLFSSISPGTERANFLALSNTGATFPRYITAASVGEVVKTGQNTRNFNEGDKVACFGKHASYAVVSEEKCYKIPEEVSLEEATFFMLGEIALQGVRKARIELGETVLVIGQGIIGNIALQVARISGAIPTIACDLSEKRLEISLSCGANYCFSKNMVEEVKNITNGKMADIVIEATGKPSVIPLAFKLTAEMGKVILLGSPRGETTINFYPEIHVKGISIIGAHVTSRPPRWTLKDDIDIVLKLIANGSLKVQPLITTVVDYKEAKTIYSKIVNEPDAFLGVIFKW
ncbi:zinc-binding alcohol dehydrogenase [bacterium]|nr:zinc-binding alcohol dehydrogenase [bacterium]